VVFAQDFITSLLYYVERSMQCILPTQQNEIEQGDQLGVGIGGAKPGQWQDLLVGGHAPVRAMEGDNGVEKASGEPEMGSNLKWGQIFG